MVSLVWGEADWIHPMKNLLPYWTYMMGKRKGHLVVEEWANDKRIGTACKQEGVYHWCREDWSVHYHLEEEKCKKCRLYEQEQRRRRDLATKVSAVLELGL